MVTLIILGSLHVVMAKLLNCSFKLSEVELQSLYFIPFWTNTSCERYEFPYPPQLKINTVTLQFSKDSSLNYPQSWYAIKQKKWRCPWCSGYRCRKWTRQHEVKSWTRLIAFHIALIILGKVWIQLFSLQLWVNSRADWILQTWWGN